MTSKVPPHGSDQLVDLLVESDYSEELKQISGGYPSITLSQRQMCDLELLMSGAFTPLQGFMGQAAYDSVVESLSLPDGTLWPVPIALDVTEAFAEKLSVGDRVALRDNEGFMPAVLTVEDIWRPDRQREAELVYGTGDLSHPGVRYLMNSVKPGLHRRKHRGRSGARCIMISKICGIRQRRCGPCSASSAGAGSWPFRPASRSIACSEISR